MITILLSKESDPKNIVSSEFFKGYTVLKVSRKKLYKNFNKFSKKKHNLVLVDYLFEDEVDLQTLNDFLKEGELASHGLFYSVRPNEYVPSKNLSFFYAKNGVLLNSISTTTNLKNFIAHNVPKNFLKKLIEFNNFFHGTFAGRKDSSLRDETSALNSSHPYINHPHIKSWIPSKSTSKRDLVERINLHYDHPSSIHIAVSNKCNLACIMCPYHSPKYKSSHTTGYFDDTKNLTYDMFVKIADYAAKNKISMQFGQIEEALLHPDIFTFITYAKTKGVPFIHITTNGTPLNKRNSKALIESGIDSVMFSLDSLDAKTYKEIRGANLNKVEESIDHFIPLAKKAGIKTMVSFIRQPQSEGQRDRFIEKWKQKGIDQVTFYVLSEHNALTGEIIRTEEFRKKGERYPCSSPWLQTVVMPDATVGLCCKTMTDIGWKITCVGDLKVQSFEEIWKGDRYSKARIELLENEFTDFQTCSSCPIWSASTYEQQYGIDYRRDFNETMETITFLGDIKS